MTDSNDLVPVEVTQIRGIEIRVGFFSDSGFALGGTTQLEPLVMKIPNSLSTGSDERDVRTITDRGRIPVDWLRQPEGIDPDFIVCSITRS